MLLVGYKSFIRAEFCASNTIMLVFLMLRFCSGSSAMFAEAVHSVADTLNQCILLFGKLHSLRRADQEHPYGYRNLQNVTALISGCGVFCIGSGLSFYHGIR